MKVSAIARSIHVNYTRSLRWFDVKQRLIVRMRPQFVSLGLLVIAGWFLGACAARPETVPLEISGNGPVDDQIEPQSSPQDLTRVDEQGAVEVAVTPINSNSDSDDILVFDVVMNTHSVDIPLNLVELSSLETDIGAIVFATAWSGGGGHHVRGLLEFPLGTPDGARILDGASQIILTIRDVDAEQRVFAWALPLSN